MCDIKDVVLKSLTTENMNKYKRTKAPADKEETVEVERREEVLCLFKSIDIEII